MVKTPARRTCGASPTKGNCLFPLHIPSRHRLFHPAMDVGLLLYFGSLDSGNRLDVSGSFSQKGGLDRMFNLRGMSWTGPLILA